MARKGQKTKVASDKSEIVKAIPRACSDETAAVEFLERMRWGDVTGCPRCGDIDVYKMRDGMTGQRNKRFLWRCRGCKQQFTVRIGTVFEDSRIPLRHWCFAFWAACSSKKGVSALQIKRQTGLTYKSALFMMHRIRWAMHDDPKTPARLTNDVQADETWVGGKPRVRPSHERRRQARMAGKPLPMTKKTPVFAVVESGGEVRTCVIADVTTATLRSAIDQYVDKSRSRLLTDEHRGYERIGREFAGGHETVTHSAGEYSRGNGITTNQVEGFFAILKRGINGVYHNVSKKHLHRYLAEFQFRYNRRGVNDGERLRQCVKAAEGKRLLYRQPVGR